MKKIMLLITALILTNSAAFSQVKIGENTVPQQGTVLDLNSLYKGGLLLPNVEITNMGKIPTDFSDPAVAGKGNRPELAGMVVWNTHPGWEGIYVWDGKSWALMSGAAAPEDCKDPPAGVSISGFAGTYNLNEEFTVTCNATSATPLLYEWAVSDDGLHIVSGDDKKTLKLKGITGKTYDGNAISCTVRNPCGLVVQVNAATGVKVNNCAVRPNTPGAMSLSETTVEWKATFTATVPNVDGVTYEWTLPDGLTGSSNSNSITITATNIDTYATGTITVAAKNDCGKSATRKSPGAIEIIWSCEGAIIKNGAYDYYAVGNMATGDYSTNWFGMTGFKAKGKDLCWNNIDSGIKQWLEANDGNTCPSPWRVPNLIELHFLYRYLGGSGGVARDFAALDNPPAVNGTAPMAIEAWSSNTFKLAGWNYYYLFDFTRGSRAFSREDGQDARAIRCVREL